MERLKNDDKLLTCFHSTQAGRYGVCFRLMTDGPRFLLSNPHPRLKRLWEDMKQVFCLVFWLRIDLINLINHSQQNYLFSPDFPSSKTKLSVFFLHFAFLLIAVSRDGRPI